MVRDRMVRVRHADLWIRHAAELAPEHERDHARQVGLIREDLQVAHQPHVLIVGGGNAGRMIDAGQFLAALLLGFLNPPFDVANRVEILDQLHAVALPERALQARDFVANGVEQAAVLPDAPLTHPWIGAAAVAEQPFEDGARIVLGRQRRARSEPGDRVGVGARKPHVARAGGLARFDRHLQRPELRERAHLPGQDLVHRDAGVEPGLAGRRRDVGQEPRARFRMCAAGASRRRHAGEIAQDQQVVFERLQWRQCRRQLEARAFGGRRPLFHHHAVRDVHHPESRDRFRSGVLERRQRRHHRVQQRQRERGTDASQNRAAWDRPLGDQHGCSYLSRRSLAEAEGAVVVVPVRSSDP